MKTIRNTTGCLLAAMMLFLLTGCAIVDIEVGASEAKVTSTVTFDANGGTGTMSNLTVANGASVNLTTNTYTRADYAFLGWATSSGATTAAYNDGASYTMGNANVTLYAVWQSTTWSHQAYLKAPNAGAADQFGHAVSVSGDTIVIGANGEDSSQTVIQNSTAGTLNYGTDSGANDSGAAYVFIRSGTDWTHQAYLKAPNAGGSDQFGYSVSISGDTIVVGATHEDSDQTDIQNSTAGTPNYGTDSGADSSGAAYVFIRSGTDWTHQAYIKAPNAGVGDNFGKDVSIDHDTIIVGAWYEDSDQTVIQNSTAGTLNYGTDSGADNSGAAYIFVRSGTTWSQQAYLKAPNAEADDNFGMSVAISGETVAVGARKESSDETTIINGTTAATDNDALGSGAVYVFVRSGTTWSQEAYIKAPNPDPYDEFGYDVALHQDTIVVGAPFESSNETTIINGPGASNDNSVTNGSTYSGAGAAYVFVRNGATWSQQAYLKAPNAGLDDFFGVRVAVSHDTIVVGASGEDSNQSTITNGPTVGADPGITADESGAAYVFTRSGTTWSHQAYLKAPNVGGADQFGEKSVCISGDTIVVGAMREDSSQTTITNGTTVGADPGITADDSGAAYVFVR